MDKHGWDDYGLGPGRGVVICQPRLEFGLDSVDFELMRVG